MMTHDDWLRWADQIEDSLVRAEKARKDIDLLILLRFAQKLAIEGLKRTEPINGDEAYKR